MKFPSEAAVGCFHEEAFMGHRVERLCEVKEQNIDLTMGVEHLPGIESGPQALSGLNAASCFWIPDTVNLISDMSPNGDGGIDGIELKSSLVNTL